MTVIIRNRVNLSNSGNIDEGGFLGFGSGGFDDDDFEIIGDEIDNILEGGIGHDLIEGKDGNDTITGGDGNDFLGGGNGDDILDGQGGNNSLEKDKLFGDAGNDILRAGFGFDELTGGSGNDVFEVYQVGHFSIKDFTIGEDRLLFDTEKTGVQNLEHLVSLITHIDQRDDGATIEFLDNAVSIELVGMNLADFTPDMVIFSLS